MVTSVRGSRLADRSPFLSRPLGFCQIWDTHVELHPLFFSLYATHAALILSIGRLYCLRWTASGRVNRLPCAAAAMAVGPRPMTKTEASGTAVVGSSAANTSSLPVAASEFGTSGQPPSGRCDVSNTSIEPTSFGPVKLIICIICSSWYALALVCR